MISWFVFAKSVHKDDLKTLNLKAIKIAATADIIIGFIVIHFLGF